MPLFANSAADLEAIEKICSLLDYSAALTTTASRAAVIQACQEAKRYKFKAVPVFPSYLPLAAEQLRGSETVAQLPCAFPCGCVATSVKKAEVIQAIEDGAREVDMVVNIARLLDRDYQYVENDIRAVVETARTANIEVKAIIEVGLLRDPDKREAVEIAVAAGAAFVKTCTGFAEGRATVREIAQLKEWARGRIRIKASGGVASLEDARAFIEAGADRVAGRANFVEQMRGLGIDGF
ncbi:MAG: deoxyribose-phosphate aldolase [Planctomycetota bacterium]|nr:deoxyribose-phosphate aldolase [Planctomycetota bacterium]